jgi:uncharacterized protein (DUF433 family)
MTATTPAIDRIQKTPGVCGGRARIANHRIPVWLIVLHRKFGRSDEEVLHSYPTLNQLDIDAAWEYYRLYSLEIERDIWFNDTVANVAEGETIPASVIVKGMLLGLSDQAICEAFDPPLTLEAVANAWNQYRADPSQLSHEVASFRQAG